jgi:rhamnosyltransferase
MLSNLYIVIVLYYPTPEQVKNILSIIQCNCCIVIDNTTNQENLDINNFIKIGYSNSIYIPLKENKGIALAQNIGIEEAKKRGAEYILFLDQDSKISKNFVQLMFAEYQNICLKKTKLAVLGPLLNNESTGILYKTNDNKINANYYIASHLISSGMLINTKVLDDVGFMDENLFIDYVDFDWCWRANAKGYICCRSKNIIMNHKVGLGDKKIFNYVITTSAPIRYYYQYRNYLKLCFRTYVPLDWKIKELFKKIFFLLYIPLISKQKVCILNNMFKGIKDGIKYFD